MQSDFAARGRLARARLAAPDVPLDAIVRRSRAAHARARLVAVMAPAALVVAAIAVAGTGAGAKIASSVHLWLSGGEATLRVTSFSGARAPLRSEFHAAIANATFPVLLPVGLPADTRVQAVYASPIGHPSMLLISYLNGRTGLKASIGLADPAAVEMGRRFSTMNAGPHAAVYDWRAGGEVVFAAKDQLPSGLAEGIKAAMAQTTPAASIAANDAMLSNIVALGQTDRIALAERYRTPGAANVLIDAQQTRSLPHLAARGEPMRDSRIFRVLSFPYVNGEPDYAHAKGWNAQRVAIPPSGVRAIAAALRARGGASADCGCEVLYSKPSAAAYDVTTIPMSGADGVRRYAVDATTFAVTAR